MRSWVPGIHTPLQIRATDGCPNVVIWVASPPFCGTRHRFVPRLGYSVSSGPSA